MDVGLGSPVSVRVVAILAHGFRSGPIVPDSVPAFGGDGRFTAALQVLVEGVTIIASIKRQRQHPCIIYVLMLLPHLGCIHHHVSPGKRKRAVLSIL